ncbi:uncharacterized protein K444DRAFT_608146 [Hyaloscypha bicolor E]|uniref:Uncharacterized protein n=1 Tax=Hyaloscypha bicolor E TaxID=1095630 RepID=A0A2J6TRB7_9HELO|nr:uncharacterized protein K444DRAFT_608146 [Hyaloscypha bicolor E]PMD65563.1 hypothetical protein K444DRAFT_608146 [Hyaloscypha bicolor E]
MGPPTGALLGINGVRVLPPGKGNDTVYIYLSNTDASTFHSVPVSLSTLQKLGSVETLFTGYALMVPPWIRVGRGVSGGRRKECVVDGCSWQWRDANCVWGGSETELVGHTSVALGRTWGEKGNVFITTQKGGVVGVDVGR